VRLALREANSRLESANGHDPLSGRELMGINAFSEMRDVPFFRFTHFRSGRVHVQHSNRYFLITKIVKFDTSFPSVSAAGASR
jgi:hypothetical protein